MDEVDLSPSICAVCQRVFLPGSRVVERDKSWRHASHHPGASDVRVVADWHGRAGVPVGRVLSLSPFRWR
jgi:hypothetical protein